MLYHHTPSTPITAGTHTSGAQYEGSPLNPDRIERHSSVGFFYFYFCFVCWYKTRNSLLRLCVFDVNPLGVYEHGPRSFSCGRTTCTLPRWTLDFFLFFLLVCLFVCIKLLYLPFLRVLDYIGNPHWRGFFSDQPNIKSSPKSPGSISICLEGKRMHA